MMRILSRWCWFGLWWATWLAGATDPLAPPMFATVAAMEAADTTTFTHRHIVVAHGYTNPGDGGGGEFYLDRSGLLGPDAANAVTVFRAAGGSSGMPLYWRRLAEPGVEGISWRWAGIQANDDPADAETNGERFRHLLTILAQSGDKLRLDAGRAWIAGPVSMPESLVILPAGGVMVRANASQVWTLRHFVEDNRRPWIDATVENLEGSCRNGYSRPEWFGATGKGENGEHNAPHLNRALRLHRTLLLAGTYNIGSEPVILPDGARLSGQGYLQGNVRNGDSSMLRRTVDGVGLLIEAPFEHGKQRREISLENLQIYGGNHRFTANLIEARSVGLIRIDDSVTIVGPFPSEPDGGYRLFYGEQIWDSQFYGRFMGGGSEAGIPSIEIRAGPRYSSNQLFFGGRMMEGFRGTALKIVGPANHVIIQGRKFESVQRGKDGRGQPVLDFENCAVVNFDYANIFWGGMGKRNETLVRLHNCRQIIGTLTVGTPYRSQPWPLEQRDGQLEAGETYEILEDAEDFDISNLVEAPVEARGVGRRFIPLRSGRPSLWAGASVRQITNPGSKLLLNHLVYLSGNRPKGAVDLTVVLYDGSGDVLSSLQEGAAVWVDPPYDPERVQIRVYTPSYLPADHVRPSNLAP